MAKQRKKNESGNGKVLNTQQAVNAAVWNICNILRRSNLAGALQYVPELSWILFLRILDEREQIEAEDAEAISLQFTPSLQSPYRWRDWAAPYDDNVPLVAASEDKPQGWKRKELQEGQEFDGVINFVNNELLPHLRSLSNPVEHSDATPRQKVIGEIMSGVQHTRVDTEKNLLDVLDRVHGISEQNIDTTHVFPLSQVFEGLLLKMGEKGNDGGQFFTPREIIRAMVKVIDPQIGETIFDPAAGTGGFLAQAFDYMKDKNPSAEQLSTLKHRTFYGREKDNIIYPIGLANMILHGIDEPHIWHGNTLTGQQTYAGLFEGAPPFFDVIMMNPPFGGKEGKAAQTNFAYKTGATQVLFLQYIIDHLRPDGGRCGMVIDEGVLFRTNETAFVQTKRKLLDDCDLWCIVSLAGGVFTAAGAGVKTNLLFFTKGKPTEKIWYYDLSDIKVGKKTPFTLDKFEDFFSLLPERGDSERSWTIDITARRQEARQQAEPLREKAQPLTAQATELRARIKELKKQNTPDAQAKIAELSIKVSTLETEARELNNKAQTIEDAVYDLKAVNPNAKSVEDTRTPEELLDLIEAKGREVQNALAVLRGHKATIKALA
jgi:Type I restriction-modification system methyltransferase subunit